ncbi:hypothetical protein [Pedosphaera parvula]|uniref:Uncharacterized protein n=1 Tax=Pedosphaera parvula (strain Ellin514) TaxID=320771 RepID=B9XAG1_PEDPL|nr:hypothetical protein [Pedosphaera parvula]EEF62996.1 hypothetical protein Cflav_PD5631 [Pedosphaera parvula Ellin514]
MNFLTEDSILMCPHGGTVQLKGRGKPSFKINGQAVICLSGLIGAPFDDKCTQVGPGLKPCTTVTSVTAGFARPMVVGRSTPLLSSVQAITDSSPPGMIHCSTVQQLARCHTAAPHQANAGSGSKEGKNRSSTQASHKVSVKIKPARINDGGYQLQWSGTKEPTDLVLLVLGNPNLNEDLSVASQDSSRVLDITKYSTAGNLYAEDLDLLLRHILSLYQSRASELAMTIQCKAVLSRGGVVHVDSADAKAVSLACPARPVPIPLKLSAASELKPIIYYFDPPNDKYGRTLTLVAASAEKFAWFRYDGKFETNPQARGMDCTTFVLSMLAPDFSYGKNSIKSNWALTGILGGVAAEMRLAELEKPVPLAGGAVGIHSQTNPASGYVVINHAGKSHALSGVTKPVGVPLIDLPAWLLAALLDSSHRPGSIKLVDAAKQAQIGQYTASLDSGLFLVWVSHHIALLLDGWIHEFNSYQKGPSGYIRMTASQWFQKRPADEHWTVVRLPNETADKIRNI